MASLP
jgi:DNA primase large subunit